MTTFRTGPFINLQILHMGDQHRSKLDEIAVCRIFHFHYAPGILTASDLLSVDLDHGVGANDGEGDRLAKLLNLRLVILILVARIGRFVNNKVIYCSVERFSYKKIIDIQWESEYLTS